MTKDDQKMTKMTIQHLQKSAKWLNMTKTLKIKYLMTSSLLAPAKSSDRINCNK